eukprot:TRINITY_DN67028_c5_g13_i1.p1 TRINITY_DN67028_c5_g13~~TRINITY_DN67028_c5_g13_i1.p1  ORF type:complete len:261 (-),score=27.15 TRINITY_DN67028_c5_g13_i1:137-919(-)
MEEKLKAMNPVYRNREDALAFYCHCALIDEGFQPCDANWQVLPEDKKLPDGWNAGESYTFHYTHERSSHNFLVKLVVLFDKLVVLCSSAQEKKVSTTPLNLDEFTLSSVPEDYNKCYTNKERLCDVIKREVSRQLVPLNESDIKTSTSSSLRDDRGRPHPPGFDPYAGGVPLAGGPPFSVGRGDLDPFGGGGNLMGPESFQGGGVGIGGRRIDPRRPPGARFDPYGPGPDGGGFGPGGMGAFGVPDPDHMAPPGYGNMFM